MASTSVALEGYSNILLVIRTEGLAENTGQTLSFNGDRVGTNYEWRTFENYTQTGIDTDGNEAPVLNHTGGSISTYWIKITNTAGDNKQFEWSYIEGIATGPNVGSGVATWNNTTNAISSIQFEAGTGADENDILVGLDMWVFAK